ncbi:hypothetical protein [Dactylosporangium sp. NPDC051541]|uniref:hypothetical protein n=1 Tax=Dactylosporangium sp. NPDC051541 TaxID=3363977 RepID=UPI0037B367FD
MRYAGRTPDYQPGALVATLTRTGPDAITGLVGTWKGRLHQSNTGEDYDVVITVRDGEIGSAATVDYPDLRCGGTLTLQHVEPATAYFSEQITRNERTPGCVTTGVVALRLNGGKAGFSWYAQPKDLSTAVAEGPLTRA